ncbi:hypothetical protein MTO96_004967 [Rhipicephalus appendiculatus]
MILNQQKALQSQCDQLQSQGAAVDKLAKLCKEQEKIIQKQNESIEKLTRLCEEQHQAKQLATIFTTPEIEAVVEAKIISIIETNVAALVELQLSAIVEPKRTAVAESRVEALVQVKLEPITALIGDTFTTLSRRMNTPTAQINELKSQLTGFMADVKNNCISPAELQDWHGRKKPRSPKEKVSHSYSPEGEQVNAQDIHENGVQALTRFQFRNRLFALGTGIVDHTDPDW